MDFCVFFLPGIYTIFLLSVLIKGKYHFYRIGLLQPNEIFISVIMIYILGYFLYSLSNFTDFIKPWILKILFTKNSSRQEIEKDIKKEDSYRTVQKILLKLFNKKNNSVKFDKFSEVRNLAMSYSTESDNKIYTFMFRSEICRIICSVNLTLLLALLCSSILSFITSYLPEDLFIENIFKGNVRSLFCYLILLISISFLTSTQFRFLRISLTLPFSIFLSKNANLLDE